MDKKEKMEKTDKSLSFEESLELEQELMNSAIQAEEAIKKEQEPKVEDPKEVSGIYELAKKYGGPLKEDIDKWREYYGGKVYFWDFDRLYIFRYVTALEWKSIMNEYNKIPEEKRDFAILDDLIYEKCILHPKLTPQGKSSLGAGIVPKISNMIQFHSGFVPDELAIRMVQKL